MYDLVIISNHYAEIHSEKLDTWKLVIGTDIDNWVRHICPRMIEDSIIHLDAKQCPHCHEEVPAFIQLALKLGVE